MEIAATARDELFATLDQMAAVLTAPRFGPDPPDHRPANLPTIGRRRRKA